MSKRHWPPATPPVYGLGEPVNRAEAPKLVPIPGRPNWFRVAGREQPVYVEPPPTIVRLCS